MIIIKLTIRRLNKFFNDFRNYFDQSNYCIDANLNERQSICLRIFENINSDFYPRNLHTPIRLF